jgi:hypothetical protein
VTNKELIKFLREHRDDKVFGGGDFDFQKSWNKFADQYGFEKDSGAVKITLSDYGAYFTHTVSQSVLQPAGAIVASLVLIFGGWVATVNASFGSLPGDFLYPVKLATERVQLTLAATSEQKARLHTEFAGRRLDEVIEISSSSVEGKVEKVRGAVESFKESITSATNAVSDIATSSPESAAAIAIAVDQKMEVMASVLSIEEVNENATEEHSEQIAEAQSSVAASDHSLTETIVSSNETAQKDSTDRYLQDSFKKDMLEIDSRSAALLVRVDNIALAVADGRTTYDFSKNLEVIREVLDDSAEQMNKAKTYFAAGGWRRVLEIVTDLKIKLTNAEELVLDMEIEISTGGSSLPAHQ